MNGAHRFACIASTVHMLQLRVGVAQQYTYQLATGVAGSAYDSDFYFSRHIDELRILNKKLKSIGANIHLPH